MTTAFSEVDHLVWYCRACGGAYKAQPDDVEKGCTCERPVESLQPTTVTQIVDNTPHRLAAPDEREAQIRTAVRPGRRVRVTFEATVDKAWYAPVRSNGAIIDHGKVVMVAIGPNGHPMVIDTGDASVTVERVEPQQ